MPVLGPIAATAFLAAAGVPAAGPSSGLLSEPAVPPRTFRVAAPVKLVYSPDDDLLYAPPETRHRANVVPLRWVGIGFATAAGVVTLASLVGLLLPRARVRGRPGLRGPASTESPFPR